jgi:hypothetical protein
MKNKRKENKKKRLLDRYIGVFIVGYHARIEGTRMSGAKNATLGVLPVVKTKLRERLLDCTP